MTSYSAFKFSKFFLALYSCQCNKPFFHTGAASGLSGLDVNLYSCARLKPNCQSLPEVSPVLLGAYAPQFEDPGCTGIYTPFAEARDLAVFVHAWAAMLGGSGCHLLIFVAEAAVAQNALCLAQYICDT